MIKRIAITCTLTLLFSPPLLADDTKSGHVSAAGKPVANAKVIIWESSGNAPKKIDTLITNKDGNFQYSLGKTKTASSFYITASKGKLELLAVAGNIMPKKVTINEITTVGSVFTHAQFLYHGKIQGPSLSLNISAKNAANFANVSTGKWGDVLVNGLNTSDSETLARVNTLGNLIALCAIPSKKASCLSFVEVISDKDKTTLDALTSIAHAPWQKVSDVFSVFESGYVSPKTDNPEERRAGVTYVPYLSYQPADFALSLRFQGGGIYSPGRITFDAKGEMWSGQNWMPGSQSGAIKGIGGGLSHLDTDGSAISPPVTGYTGMGVDGVGWGTAVSNKKVWVTSFNSTIGVFDFAGKPLGPKEGITLDGKIGQGQGIAIAPNGDVWTADSTKDQMVYFPKGDINKGRIIKVDGLHAPFDVAVDQQNRVWVTNSRGDNVTVFPADAPEKAKQVIVGLGVRGIALDSTGNAWIATNMALDFPAPVFPKGEIPIMKEFEVAYAHLVKYQAQLPTGLVTMITPDLKVVKKGGFLGKDHVINVPWGVALDGDENLWVGNFVGESILYMCGANTNNCPKGTKTGDVIFNFTSGNTQMITGATIDPAGNVWTANNWNVGPAILAHNPDRKISTKGGGTSTVVFYGIAKPVKTPLIGAVESALN